MKSLLLKDLYVMKGTIVTFSIILLVFIVVGINNFMFLIMAFAFASIQSVSVFNQEASCRWENFAGGLPLTRKTQVLEKYVFILIPLAVVSALTTVILLGMGIFAPERNRPDLLMLIMMAFLSLIIPSFTIPVLYKVGPEKGQLLSTILAGILFGAMAGGAMALDEQWDGMPAAVPLGAIVLSILLLAGSYCISLRIYSKKDL
ncbi:MAG: ABC-2 transporter permease [Clostridia bacterium]